MLLTTTSERFYPVFKWTSKTTCVKQIKAAPIFCWGNGWCQNFGRTLSSFNWKRTVEFFHFFQQDLTYFHFQGLLSCSSWVSPSWDCKRRSLKSKADKNSPLESRQSSWLFVGGNSVHCKKKQNNSSTWAKKPALGTSMWRLKKSSSTRPTLMFCETPSCSCKCAGKRSTGPWNH